VKKNSKIYVFNCEKLILGCFSPGKDLARTWNIFISFRECPGAGHSTPAVLNLMRLEDHLQILSLGGGPPLKIVP